MKKSKDKKEQLKKDVIEQPKDLVALNANGIGFEVDIRREDFEGILALGNNFLQLNVNAFTENYPDTVKQGISEVIEVVNKGLTIPELYKDIVEEISVGQSMIQSQAVQMEQHFTPHRKLRQFLLEYDGKLGALDAAKNGQKKALIKMKTLVDELQNLKDIYLEIKESNTISFAQLMTAAMYVPSLGNNRLLIDSVREYDVVSTPSLIEAVLSKIKKRLGDKFVEYDEAARGIKSHQHMVKDAAQAAHHLKELVDKYKEEAAETGWSYEQAEIYYYVMYFTKEGEQQIRTGGRVDTGTFGVVCCLPDPLQKKIMSNWELIQKLHRECLANNNGVDNFHGYYHQTHKAQMEPEETPDGFEGVTVKDIIGIDVPKLIAKNKA